MKKKSPWNKYPEKKPEDGMDILFVVGDIIILGWYDGDEKRFCDHQYPETIIDEENIQGWMDLPDLPAYYT